MKGLAVQAVAMTLLLTGSAVAADIPRPVPIKSPAPVVAAYNWSGCYVGVGGGYGFSNSDDNSIEDTLGQAVPQRTYGGRGWFGTVQGGCDYQFGQNLVVGAFADYDLGNIKGDSQFTTPFGSVFGQEKQKWSWAVGGRLGWVVFDRLLTFVSAGYTQAHYDGINFTQADGLFVNFVNAQTYRGWFIGTGYEYGISWLPGFTWKTEYRFASYDNEPLRVFVASSSLPTAYVIDKEKSVHTVRSELVWRFNFGGPVVARY